jgi:hypothetical protein
MTDNILTDAQIITVAREEEIRVRRLNNPYNPADNGAIAIMDAWFGEMMHRQAQLPKK